MFEAHRFHEQLVFFLKGQAAVVVVVLVFFSTIPFSLVHITLTNNLSEAYLTRKLFYERSNIEE